MGTQLTTRTVPPNTGIAPTIGQFEFIVLVFGRTDVDGVAGCFTVVTTGIPTF